jgi:aminomethyltransferase
MGEGPTASVQKTRLHALCRELGARLVDFAGWEMPVQFSSVIDEHLAVRTAAGVFDVSHMGEIAVEGTGALAVVQKVTCNDAGRLVDGQAQYSALLTADGTFVDDILVYRRGAERFLLVVNAGNADKAFAWVSRHASGDAEVRNDSKRFAQLAVQGPRAQAILQGLTAIDLSRLGSYRFAEGEVLGATSIVSRTGYTGEDGFEVYGPPEAAADLFRALLERGRGQGLLPCGLGARDTLRLEARLALYGNDIDETTTPLEAGLRWIVKSGKGDFIGRDALLRQERDGIRRTLAGFEMTDRGIARHGYAVRIDGREAGVVTSGTFAPYLKKNIGLAYVPKEKAEIGSRLGIVIRDRDAAAVIVETPFYKRTR